MCRFFNCEDLSGGPTSWAVRNSTDLYLLSRVLLRRNPSCFFERVEEASLPQLLKKIGKLAGVDPSSLHELGSRVVQCQAGPDVT